MDNWSAYACSSQQDEEADYVGLADILSDAPVAQTSEPDPRKLPNHDGFAFGRYHCELIRPALQFFNINLTSTENVNAETYMEPGICLGVCFEGGWTETLGDQTISYGATDCAVAIGTNKRRQVIVCEEPGRKIRAASLLIGEDFIKGMKQDVDDHSFDALDDLMTNEVVYREITQSPSLVFTFKQMAANPFHGGMAKLHLESLALSAIIELAEHIRKSNPARHQRTGGQKTLAQDVRNIVAQSLDDLPKISDMAVQLGTNSTTLRRAFKATYGMTLMDYIREQRLEAARIMLREGKFQIAEIAYRVGYANPANFTNAFRRQFGYAPKFEATKT